MEYQIVDSIRAHMLNLPFSAPINMTNEKNITRREFLKASLAGLGGAAMLGLNGCNLEPKKEKEIPMVDLAELIDNPEDYEGADQIKTHGYPKLVGESTLMVPQITFYKIGNVPMTRTDWIIKRTSTYNLHTANDKESPSFKFFTEKDTQSFGAPIVPSGGNYPSEEEFVVTGKVTKIRSGDEKEEEYALNASSVSPIQETPTSEK